jgi:hypothetical protein
MKLPLQRLIELNAKTDKLISFDYYDEEEQRRSMGPLGYGAAALATGGAGYGAYRAYPHVKTGAISAYDAAKQASAPIGQYASNVKGAYQRGVFRGEKGLSGVLRGVRGAARMITKGKSKYVGLSSRLENLIQLNEKIDSLITFDKETDDDADDMKGKKKGGHLMKDGRFMKGKMKKKIAY